MTTTNDPISQTDDRGVVEVLDVAAYLTVTRYYDQANGRWTTDADVATCGACGRSWDDAVTSSATPTPSARCPFEYDHEDEDDEEQRFGPFTLTVDTENAAFVYAEDEEGGAEAELARILRDLADRLESDCGRFDVQGTVRDLNGNTVGTWTR